MSLSKHFPSGSNGLSGFSDDLIKEVLVGVPVKSLLRCKAVCKHWCSLITCPSFVKSHLTITRPGDDETLIVHDMDNMERSTSTISLLHMGSRQLVADLRFPYSKDEFSFTPYSKIVGSANGIVCFVAYNDHPRKKYGWFLHTTNIYLWNPATKQSKLIPPQTILREYNIGSYGFGFDPVDNDFKVVRSINYPFTTEVYSMNMNVWRMVGVGVGDNKPDKKIPLMGKSNVCVNGFLCWTGGELYDILAFDLHKEVYNCDTKFPVRPKEFVRSDNATTISTLNDTIALIMWEKFNAKIDLWTLDNVECFRGCGVKASWTQMLSINADLSLPLQYVHSYFTNGDFLLTSSGDMLKRDDSIWFSYNSDKKLAKKVPFSVYWHQIFKYKESLVSILGSKQVRWNAQEDAI